MSDLQDKQTIDLLFGNSEIEAMVQGMASSIQAISPDLAASEAVLLSRGLLARQELFNSLNEIQAKSFLFSAIEVVRQHGAMRSIPVLQEMLVRIAQ